MEEAHDLGSSMEEADTRMVLYAHHVEKSQEYQAVVIAADDTDVLVLALGLANSISLHMYQNQVHQEVLLIWIYLLCQNVLPQIFVMRCRTSLHAFKCCDQE